MPRSTSDLHSTLARARSPQPVSVAVDGREVMVPRPFPSPEDWRDVCIYFLMVDRFANPSSPPASAWDREYDGFQGGNLAGIRAQLAYLQQLGVGAVWLSPVLKNCQYLDTTYHGYGIQDFLAVDPRLAADPDQAHRDPTVVEAELRELVDEAHARGIYVILDIVLNHAGDVFDYDGLGPVAPWRDEPPYPIRWRDADGTARADWAQAPPNPPADAAVWPAELRDNAHFRRHGNAFDRPAALQEAAGDFYSLKELVTDPEQGGSPLVRDTLIRAYQHFIAAFDVDGFRIDTLKYLEPGVALVVGNAIREYALSIGKRNFFTFGEVYDEEDKIARFIGRRASDPGELVGVDAALDFPLFFRLPRVAKGLAPPSEVVGMFQRRKQVEQGVISSHGEASRFFVTFLDNHDQPQRFYHADQNDPHRYDDQVTLALGCLAALQGIPCVYYGTEQGLHGAGTRPEAVREALWGKPGAFDPAHPFAQALRELLAVRRDQPALRYGRQYFRPISGNGTDFGVSSFAPGVLAWSRILSDLEVVVVANTNTTSPWSGEVLVDRGLNAAGATYQLLYSSNPAAARPGPVADKLAGSVAIREVDGSASAGPARALPVTLAPMELQILKWASQL
jgi:glycosidase